MALPRNYDAVTVTADAARAAKARIAATAPATTAAATKPACAARSAVRGSLHG
jgi:hypothetical protein